MSGGIEDDAGEGAKTITCSSLLEVILESGREARSALKNQLEYRNKKRRGKRNFYKTYVADIKQNTGTAMKDFERLTTIGSGTFATVELVKNWNTRMLSAVKIIEKKRIVKYIRHCRNEKRIQQAVDHPFIVKMYSYFMDKSKIYYNLEYCQGGDLCDYLLSNGRQGTEEARFIGAQMTMALAYLHSVGVVHRDLKVENIMLDDDGYAKLSDFGFAKKIDLTNRTYTICGSYNYMAPEVYWIINGESRSYGYSADWWSLGVMMYTMATRSFPFGELDDQNYPDSVTEFIDYPDYLDRSHRKFIRGLLKPKVEYRLGCGRLGSFEVRNHSFFEGINWSSMYLKRIPSPIVRRDSGPVSLARPETIVDCEDGEDFEKYFKDF